MIREVHVEVGGGPAREGLGLQGGVVQGLVDERMKQAQGEAGGEGCQGSSIQQQQQHTHPNQELKQNKFMQTILKYLD